jgi:hypothetical protein
LEKAVETSVLECAVAKQKYNFKRLACAFGCFAYGELGGKTLSISRIPD